MALIQTHKGELSGDLEHFKQLYEIGYEEFIGEYEDDNIIIDLEDKIVVSLTTHCLEGKTPLEVLAVFIPEDERLKYKSILIYSGHIAFVKCEFENGKVIYKYKDDECYPQTLEEVLGMDNHREESTLMYSVRDYGFTKEDVITHIERYIQVNYDFNYKIEDISKVVVLQGL